MADTDKPKDTYTSALVASIDYSEILRKASEAIEKLDFSKVKGEYSAIVNLSDYLDNPKDVVTQELLKYRYDWCESITSISANLSSWFERSKSWKDDISDYWKALKKSYEAIDVTPLTESAEKATEALTGEPDKPYTEKEAEAALPKLVNFAKQYDEVAEAIITVSVKTKSGGQAVMSAKMTREQIMSGMEIDRAFVNGEPTMIALPRKLNRELGARKHSIVIDGDQPAALPPPEPAEDLVTLGSYARQFIEKADRLTHAIHFKNGDKLELLADRDIAWQIVECLLQNGEIKDGGWVTLPPELQDKKWSSQFLVPVKPLRGGSAMADPRHDMTKVRHHIETDAKKGRRPENAPPPKYRFCRHINHKTYDPVNMAYKAAVKEQKRRDAQPK